MSMKTLSKAQVWSTRNGLESREVLKCAGLDDLSPSLEYAI